jgi:protein subunit release factor A
VEQLHADALELQKSVDGALGKIGYEKLQARKAELDKLAADPDLWQDNEQAQGVLREQASLEKRLSPWRAVRQGVEDVLELSEMGDTTLLDDLSIQLRSVNHQFTELKEELKFSGPVKKLASRA